MIRYTTLSWENAEKYRKSVGETINTLTSIGDHTKESFCSVLEEILAQWTVPFIAIDDECDEVVGYVTLVLERWLQKGGSWAGHIECLAVRKERQWKKIWSTLLTLVIAEAKKKGCYKIIGQAVTGLAKYYQKFWLDTSEIGLKMYL